MGTCERRSHTQSMLPCSQNPTPCSARIFLNPCLARFFSACYLDKGFAEKYAHSCVVETCERRSHTQSMLPCSQNPTPCSARIFLNPCLARFFQPAILIKTLRKNTRIAVLQESADIDIWRGGPLRPPDKFIRNTSFFITLNPTPKT